MAETLGKQLRTRDDGVYRNISRTPGVPMRVLIHRFCIAQPLKRQKAGAPRADSGEERTSVASEMGWSGLKRGVALR